MSEDAPRGAAPDEASDETLRRVAMSRGEYERLCRLLDRDPSPVELGMAAALLSEHCGYKHSL